MRAPLCKEIGTTTAIHWTTTTLCKDEVRQLTMFPNLDAEGTCKAQVGRSFSEC